MFLSNPATSSVHSRAFSPSCEQARDRACASVLGTNAAVVAAQSARHAHICERIRGRAPQVGQSGATPFPPPLWERDRERGKAELLLAHVYDLTNPAECRQCSCSSLERASRSMHRRHPSPCPSPTRGEGTVGHAPSQLAQYACGGPCDIALLRHVQ